MHIVVPPSSGAANILRETLLTLRLCDKSMQTDLAGLNRACCTPHQQVYLLEGRADTRLASTRSVIRKADSIV